MLTIRLFGTFELLHNGEPLPLSARKERWLLARLVLNHGNPLPRTLLMDALWPAGDSDQGDPAHYLRRSLTSLRKALGENRIVTPDRQRVGFDLAGVWTDVLAFDAAAAGSESARHMEALALYRGTLLPDCSEIWVMGQRAAREEAYRRMVTRIAADALEGEEAQWVISLLRKAQRLYPLWEEGCRLLMQALAAQGKPHEAQETYQELIRLLRRENPGALPEAATRQMHQHIRLGNVPENVSPRAVMLDRSLRTDAAAAIPPVSLVRAGRLPQALTKLIGREEERQEVITRLRQSRLVTLTGTGGIGKTRLAVVVAEALWGAFEGAVWFVDLSNLQASQQIPDALLEILALPRFAHPREQIIERLARQPSLLVLDNFEHLLSPSDSEMEDGASFLRTLMQRVPTLTCLVTSRQRLGLNGEREFPLLPMPVPHATESPENLLRYACVQMFVDRAQATLPDFQVTPGNVKAVAALSIQLEGIPLAIELAAAWVQTLTPAQMAAKLEKRFDLLASHRKDLPARHRTLYATLEWSYSLLSHDLQRFFVQLSVFSGGWALEAMSAVCEEPRALEFLRVLQERSLVVSEEVGQVRRFRLLETLREFGWGQLSPGEQAALQERRADYYLCLANIHSGAPPHLENELENFRRALDWCQTTRNAEKGLRLAVALRYVWLAGYGQEGQYWIKLLLALDESVPASLQAEAILCVTLLSLPYNDFAHSHHFAEYQRDSHQKPSDHISTPDIMDEFIRTRPSAMLEGALNTILANGNASMSAFALCSMGNILRRRGENICARQLLEESITFYRTLEDSFGMQLALNSLGDLLMEHKDYADAISLFEESLAHCRPGGSLQGVLRILWLKGTALQRQGNREQAEKVLDESLQIGREQGNQETLLGLLRNLGFLAMEREDYQRAYALFAEGLAIAQRIGHQENRQRHLRYLGVCALQQKEYAAARTYFEQHLALCQGAYSLVERASSLTDIALTFLEEGKIERARTLLHQSLILFGNQARMHYALEGSARLAVHLGKMAAAAKLFGMADRLREMRLVELPVVLRVHRDSALRLACEQIGEEAFQQAWAEGRTLSQKQALELAMPLLGKTSPAE